MIRAEVGQEEFQFWAARIFPPRGGHGMAIAVQGCVWSLAALRSASLARSLDRSIDSKLDRDRHQVIATAAAASEDVVLASSSSASPPCAFFWFWFFVPWSVAANNGKLCRSGCPSSSSVIVSSSVPLSPLCTEEEGNPSCRVRSAISTSASRGVQQLLFSWLASCRRGIRSKKVCAGRWRCVPGLKQQYRRLGLSFVLALVDCARMRGGYSVTCK